MDAAPWLSSGIELSIMDAPAISVEIKKMEPGIKEDSKDFQVAVLMVSMLEIGTDPMKLFHFTGYGRLFIRETMKKWEENGVVKDGFVYGDWLNEEYGVIAFWLDVLVGMGMVEIV